MISLEVFYGQASTSPTATDTRQKGTLALNKISSLWTKNHVSDNIMFVSNDR